MLTPSLREVWGSFICATDTVCVNQGPRPLEHWVWSELKEKQIGEAVKNNPLWFQKWFQRREQAFVKGAGQWVSCMEEHFLELSFDIIFMSFCQGGRSFGELEEMERLQVTLKRKQQATKLVLCIAELLELWFWKHFHTEEEQEIKAGKWDCNVTRDDARRAVRHCSSDILRNV